MYRTKTPGFVPGIVDSYQKGYRFRYVDSPSELQAQSIPTLSLTAC